MEKKKTITATFEFDGKKTTIEGSANKKDAKGIKRWFGYLQDEIVEKSPKTVVTKK